MYTKIQRKQSITALIQVSKINHCIFEELPLLLHLQNPEYSRTEQQMQRVLLF